MKYRMQLVSYLCLVFIIWGCDPMMTLPDGTTAINGVLCSCSNPYPLTRHCSEFSGPKRMVNILGKKMKIASNDEGTILLIMSGDFNFFRLDSGVNDESANCLSIVKHFFNRYDIRILETIPMVVQQSNQYYTGPQLTYAHFVILESDGYSVLKEFFVE